MQDLGIDYHLVTLISIMLISGAFGGLLNYLHSFDVTAGEAQSSVVKYKYVLLGIGAAFLIPLFLNMISSTLISKADNNNYLIFAGFCLIAAIFSRRFITTIGDKILEAAKKAEKAALESKQKADNTQLELTSTKERIEDVKLAVDIKNIETKNVENPIENPKELLINLANSYIKKTSVPDYSQRLKLKAELGRKMGEIVVRNNLSKKDLLDADQSEGMLLAISYSVQLRPDKNDLKILNQVAKLATQLYTKYSILVSYDTLSRNNYINTEDLQEVHKIIQSFLNNADPPLVRKIEDTTNILNITIPKL